MMFCVIKKKKKNAFSSWYQQYQCSLACTAPTKIQPYLRMNFNNLQQSTKLWTNFHTNRKTVPECGNSKLKAKIHCRIQLGYEGTQAKDTSSRWCATLKLNKWRVFLEHSIVMDGWKLQMWLHCTKSHVRKHFLISNLLCDNIVQRPATGTLWQ